jgi:Uma2 family endonuclease
MTIQTPQQIGMPLDEFLAEQERQPFEILFGERVPIMPNSSGHAWLIRALFRLLDQFVVQHVLGEVFSETTYSDLADANWVRGSRDPDVLFITAERFEQFKREYPNLRFLPAAIAPDLTIEVISPTETFSQTSKKVKANLSNGVRLMWLVDEELNQVTEHYNGQIRILGLGDTLGGKDVLPGFTLALDNLFGKIP